MNNDSIIFIGFGTHKSFVQIATLKEHRGAKPETMAASIALKPLLRSFPGCANSNSPTQDCILSTKRIPVVTGSIGY